MATRERNKFSRTVAHLEREALKLGEDVGKLMRSGKEMAAQELKDLRKLLKKTAKTAKSASHRESRAAVKSNGIIDRSGASTPDHTRRRPFLHSSCHR